MARPTRYPAPAAAGSAGDPARQVARRGLAQVPHEDLVVDGVLWPPPLRAFGLLGVDTDDLGAPTDSQFRNIRGKVRGHVKQDVLVGADGIDSLVRRTLWGDVPKREHRLHVFGRRHIRILNTWYPQNLLPLDGSGDKSRGHDLAIAAARGCRRGVSSMRLATFTTTADADATAGAGAGQPRTGVVSGERVHPFPPGLTMRDLVERGLDEVRRLADEALAADGHPLADVRLLAPLAPASVRDFVAFEEHVQGIRQAVTGTAGVPDAWYDGPTFYFTNPHAILGPDETVPFPAACAARDLELEVAVVVTGAGRSLSVEQARDHVFGYTIMNDWSARDLQAREMQVSLGPAKGKDFATTLGPWIVTADELEPFRDEDGFLRLWCAVSVNGAEIGRDLLSNMGWTFEVMIAYASRDSRIEAGDVLGSGTVGNGGCLGELWGRRGTQDPPPLAPGDVVTLTVEGLGSLTNVVGVAEPAPELPAARLRDPALARKAASP